MAAISIKCPKFESSEVPMALRVLSEALEDLMYTDIREEHGAYGLAVDYQEFAVGVFTVATFSDPGPDSTVATVEKVLQKVADGQFSEESVNYAVVRAFSDLSKPRPPKSKGWRTFFNDWDPEWLQSRIRMIADMTKEKLMDAAKLLLDNEWRYCIASNESIAAVPEGFIVENCDL
jgi:Zn-dependent M16 (insulinase) family peptidase